jgi:hypothetical protein
MAKVVYYGNRPSWELDDDEKLIAERAREQRASAQNVQSLISSAEEQRNKLVSTLDANATMDRKTSIDFQKELNEYKANLKRLGMYGGDVTNALSGAESLQSVKSQKRRLQNALDREETKSFSSVKQKHNDLRKLGIGEEYDPVTGFVMPTTSAALKDAERTRARVIEAFTPPAQEKKYPEGFLNDITNLPEGYSYDPVTGMVLKPRDEWLRTAGHNVASAYLNILGQAAASEKGIPKADINKLNPYEMIDPKTGGIAGEVGPDKNLINKIFGRSKEDFYAMSDTHAEKGAEIAAKRKSELSKFGGFIFDVGVEGLHLGSQIAANFAVPGAGIVLLGTRAYGNASAEARRAGATEEQAMIYGLGSAALEIVVERISNLAVPFRGAYGKGTFDDALEKLIKRLAASDTGRRVLTVIASGLGEGFEESFQSAVDPILKRLVYDKSALEAYTDPEQRKEHIANMLYEGLVGFALGMVAGGGQVIIEGGIQRGEAKRNYGPNIQELIDESLKLEPDNYLARSIQARLNQGKQATGGQIIDLINQTERKITQNDKALVQDAAAKRLTELGEQGDVQPVASALAKLAARETLTRKESNFISESRFGERVANELNPENIRSGQTSSDWAQRINTDTINAAEYSRLIEAAMAETGEQTPTDATELPTMKDAAIPSQDIDTTENITQQTPQAALEQAGKKYGRNSGVFVKAYRAGQDVDSYAAAYDAAFFMGQENVPKVYLNRSVSTKYLAEAQRDIAYETGKYAREASAAAQDAALKSLKTESTAPRRKGAVVLDNVRYADLNTQQRTAHSIFTRAAQITGMDIVLYQSDIDAEGKYIGEQGRYDGVKDPGTLYIDINAGLIKSMDASNLSNYAMVRTFAHEFTHFIEHWSKTYYNELQRAVFDRLHQQGENVNELIESKIGNDTSEDAYARASREVVAEALTDILPDSKFAETLATEHKGLFEKLVEKLKEFVNNIKAYYKKLGPNRSAEANALKETINDTVKYFDEIIEAFDRAAVDAVENYQADYAYNLTAQEAFDKTASGAVESFQTTNITAESRVENENQRRMARDSESDTSERYDRGNRESSGRDVDETSGSSETQWRKLDSGQRSEIVETLKAYAIGNEEVSYFLEIFAKGDLSSTEARNQAFELMAEAFYDSLSTNRILTENDPRFRWVGDDLSSLIEDVEGIKNKPEATKETARPAEVQYQLRGYNSDDIEVYETSDEIKALPWSERRKKYLDIMKNEYRGRTARFVRNGHIYYAEFDRSSLTKPIYGEKRSSVAGEKAIINAGADGDIFSLVENSKYDYSKADTKNHKKTDYFDYFVKTVQIDGRVFDLHADVKKQYGVDGGYIYTLYLRDNYKVKASPARGNQMAPLHTPGNAFTEGNVSQTSEAVKSDAENILTDDQHQERIAPLTNREVLEYAAEQVKTGNFNDAEKAQLGWFKRDLNELRELHAKLDEEKRRYNENKDATTREGKDEAIKAKNNIDTLNNKIKKVSDKLLKFEEAPVLKKILIESRKVIESAERAKRNELIRQYRQRRNESLDVQKYRRQVQKEVKTLGDWITKPSGQAKNALKHVPDVLKNDVIDFLKSIDFMSKRQLRGGEATLADKANNTFIERLEAVQAALEQHQTDTGGLYSGYSDLPENFMKDLEDFKSAANKIVRDNKGDYVVNQMNSAELKELAHVLKTLRQHITTMNKFHTVSMFNYAYEAGDNSYNFMKVLEPPRHTGNLSNFVLWQQIRPALAFERFGEGGKAIYRSLMEAQGKLAFHTETIKEFAEKTYTADEVKAWSKETKTIKFENGDVVQIPVTHIMSFYELSKRPHALTHILGEGIRVATYTQGKKGRQYKYSDVGRKLTMNDVSTMIDALSPRQKQVADALQKFMAEQGGEWGNYVSLARFGEQLFGEKEYFPINVDGRHLPSTAEMPANEASLYALLNMSFTKQLKENAKNRLILYNIFDVFSNHMSSMAQYNAFALPVLDTLKWFNYKGKTIDADGNEVGYSVREEMARAFGAPEETKPGKGESGYAEKFVVNMIKALNGTEAQGVPTDAFGMKALHRFNRARVAANLRVVMQQPLAITRAGLIIDYNSILRGLKLSPTEIKANIAEMEKHSGIAAWKNLGFYDVNISRGMNQIIKGDADIFDKVTDWGLYGAEVADRVTWAAMWNACKEEVNRKQTKLEPGTDEYFKAVTDLFEEVIYKTQVVDSVLTKNEFLRSKGLFARLTGSFMSEPTTSASMLIEAFNKYQMDLQRGMTPQQAFKNNSTYIGRTAYVYAITAILQAIVTAIADAWRDDDDYANFLEKTLDKFTWNFIDEIVPLNKLPIGSDLYELIKSLLGAFTDWDVYGFEPRSVYMQWRDSLVKGTEILKDLIKGKNTRYTEYAVIYKYMQVVSDISGMPFSTLTREIVALWNNTFPSMKIRSYDASERSQIKYAWLKGYLDDEEATEALIEEGVAKDEDAAYWLLQQFEAEADGGSFAKYDKLYEAMLSGEGFDEAFKELTDHGVKKNNIRTEIRKRIGAAYKNKEISKQKAVDMLKKYGELDNDEIAERVNKWSCVVVTGIEYDDIMETYIKGEITAKRAKDMLKLYGGLTQEQADDKILVADFQEKHPDIEWGAGKIEHYKKTIEPLGITVPVYDQYVEERAKCTGIDANNDGKADRYSEQDQVIVLIDSLPLTKEQKDALFLSNGWAASSLRRTPWNRR